MRMVRKDQEVLGLAKHGLGVGFDLDANRMCPLPAIDREQSMRRHAAKRLDVVVIVLESVLADDLLFLLLFLLQVDGGERRGNGRRSFEEAAGRERSGIWNFGLGIWDFVGGGYRVGT